MTPPEDSDQARTTMADVARRAGVGPSTVSRVVRNHPSVSPAARARVHEAIRHLDYRVDTAARSLRTGRTHCIAVVVSDLANPAFTEIVATAERELTEAGYSMYVASHGQLVDRESHLVDQFAGGVDGVILSTPDDRRAVIAASLQRRGVPVLLLDRQDPEGQRDWVSVDHRAGTCTALEALIDAGHERILLLGRRPAMAPGRAAQDAVDAARAKHHRCQIDFVTTDMRYDEAFKIVSARLSGPDAPTAVIAPTTQLTVGALDAIRTLGLDTPRDLALVGSDDTVLCRLARPDISALARDLTGLSREAVRLILTRIALNEDSNTNRGQGPLQYIIPLTFVERASTLGWRPPATQRLPRKG